MVRIKDYIKHPKDNGYRSYHMHVLIPVRMLEGEQLVKLEIQIRTVAMDFWASLEHKIRYKNDPDITDQIGEELLMCATLIEKIDSRMQSLNKKIMSLDCSEPQHDGTQDYFDLENTGEFENISKRKPKQIK